MLRDRQNVWRRLNLLGDLILTHTALLGMILVFSPEQGAYDAELLFIIASIVWVVFLYGPSGSYFYRLKPLPRVFKELYWSLAKAFAVFIAAVFFLGIDMPSHVVAAFFAADVVLLTVSRLTLVMTLNIYRLRGRSNRNVIIIGSGPKAKRIADRILENKNWGIRILGFLDYHRSELWR